MKHALILGIVTLLPAIAAGDEVDEFSDAATTSIQLDARTSIENQMAEYLDSPKIRSMIERGAWIESSASSVDVSGEHKDWVKYRVLTYRKAWADVQESFIRYQNNVHVTEVTRKLFSDASGTPPTYQPDRYTGNQMIDEFVDKSGAYIGKKLDNALIEVGVDPTQYDRANSKQRKNILRDSIQERATVRSFGKLSGLWLLKSFTGSSNGRQAVGVVGIYQAKYEEVARDIASGSLSLSQGKAGKAIRDAVPRNVPNLAKSFGIRLLRDENGDPAIVAFGQWGVSGNLASPAAMDAFRSAAVKQARNVADNELALFLAGSANFSDESLIGSTLESNIDVDSTGFLDYSESIEIQDIINQVLQARGRMQIAGLRDLHTWTYRHPETDKEIVGVVRVWTLGDARASQEVRNAGRSNQRAAGGRTADAEGQEDPIPDWNEESPDYGDPDEF